MTADSLVSNLHSYTTIVSKRCTLQKTTGTRSAFRLRGEQTTPDDENIPETMRVMQCRACGRWEKLQTVASPSLSLAHQFTPGLVAFKATTDRISILPDLLCHTSDCFIRNHGLRPPLSHCGLLHAVPVLRSVVNGYWYFARQRFPGSFILHVVSARPYDLSEEFEMTVMKYSARQL